MKTHDARLRRRFPAARLVLCLLLVALTAGGLTTPGRAAGVFIHNEIIGRAIAALDAQAYPELAAFLAENQDVVTYGAMFPDWGYAMAVAGKGDFYRDYAEVAHDPGFRAALSAYLVPAFRRLPGSEDDRRAIAFLFGLISHQVVDTRWHDLGGNPQAFEVVASQMDGNNGTNVEFGSELFVINSPKSYYGPFAMYSPAEAVQNAYRAFGIDVSAEALGVAKSWQAVQMAGEVLAAKWGWVYWWYEIDLTWAHDNLWSYQPGGLQDGATHTAAAWQQTWDWFSDYEPITTIGLSPALPDGADGWYRLPVTLRIDITAP